MKIVNQTVASALKNLGYTQEKVTEIIAYIATKDTIEGAPGLKEEHLPVFDCSFQPANGKRFIAASGHVKMLAATQPFISGAASKTVNMPSDSTVEHVQAVYMDAWSLGIK